MEEFKFKIFKAINGLLIVSGLYNNIFYYIFY